MDRRDQWTQLKVVDSDSRRLPRLPLPLACPSWEEEWEGGGAAGAAADHQFQVLLISCTGLACPLLHAHLKPVRAPPP